MNSLPGKADKSSVVVCSKNRPDLLKRCLTSLEKLTPSPLEVLVVDNDDPGSCETRGVVARYPFIRTIREQGSGLSKARNTGVRNARGQMILFTDDDTQVQPHWAGQLQKNFEDPHVMAVTGLVLPTALDTEAQVIFENDLEGFGRGNHPKVFGPSLFNRRKRWGFPAWEMGAGANMAFRRDIFEEVGYFDERLGAGAAGCSEDSELWYRILAFGGTCRYDPTAVVYHQHRETMEALKQQMKAYMRGHVTSLLIQFQRHGHWGNLRRLFILLPRYYTRLHMLGLFSGFQGRYSLLPHEIRGCFSGILFHLRNRKSA